MSRISPIDEIKRKELGGRGPQNHLASIMDYRLKDFARLAVRQRRKYRFYNHMSGEEIKKLVGDNIWNSYYKFCFERNPFDRLVSLYYWRNKIEPRPTITEFMDSDAFSKLKEDSWNLYTSNDEIIVDKVCKFENLVEDLEEVRLRLALPEPLILANAKGSHRKDTRHYRDILTDEHRNRIESVMQNVLREFGYEF